MELIQMMQNRRSVRKYTGEPVGEEALKKVVQAGLLSESGKGLRPWEFIVVQDKEMLRKMADCRAGRAKMLDGADCAVVVLGDSDKTDVWTEDCSVAMAHMHLMADSLGLGSCWLQGRLRKAEDGRDTEEFLRELLGYPANYKLEAVLVLGMPAEHAPAYDLEALPMEKVHGETFGKAMEWK
ncbi:nitroreductase [Lachnospiraceae bacterium KGMB03038]|nr:nitroreductase [Lachnospiraceae bacterium KGMB03038]